jgi:hypothetical protein
MSNLKNITKYEVATILGMKMKELKKLLEQIDDLIWLLVGKS